MSSKDNLDNLESMNRNNINWYPGHMYKTKKELEKVISDVDIVLELADARAPLASFNEDIQDIVSKKQSVILLNKKDLADKGETKNWIEFLEKKYKDTKVLDINAASKEDAKKILKEIKENKYIKEKTEKEKSKGIENPKINILIVGIPNVGKSTLINNFVGKNSQEVKNIPGVTKKNKWIRTKENINILDTPGILWPKLEENTGMYLASIGSIKIDLVDKIELSNFILKKIISGGYSELLEKRYDLKEDKNIDDIKKIANNIDILVNNIKILSENLDNIKEYKDLEIEEKIRRRDEKIAEYVNKLFDYNFVFNAKIYELFIKIGEKRGFLKKGNAIDEEKTASVIINEFQKGVIGKITLQKV